jgi:hypothetical protein
MSGFDYIAARRWALGMSENGELFDNGLSAHERWVLIAIIEHMPHATPSLSRLSRIVGEACRGSLISNCSETLISQ